MIFYQLKNKETGLYYCRGRCEGKWVKQEVAAAWTTKKSVMRARQYASKKAEIEVVTIRSTWPSITLVKCGNWEGMYVNGALTTQATNLTIEHALRAVGFDVDVQTRDLNYMNGKPTLPEHLENL